jgi:hypothetical protein
MASLLNLPTRVPEIDFLNMSNRNFLKFTLSVSYPVRKMFVQLPLQQERGA